MRRNVHLRAYVLSFIESDAPHPTAETVGRALAGGRVDSYRFLAA
jgi:hypothetical protein